MEWKIFKYLLSIWLIFQCQSLIFHFAKGINKNILQWTDATNKLICCRQTVVWHVPFLKCVFVKNFMKYVQVWFNYVNLVLIQLRDEDLSTEMQQSNWFSAPSALRVYGQYLNLDKDHNGMLSKEELAR